MAMRPTGDIGVGASARRPTHDLVRPVYEDFKPKSEWQQDDDFHILSIHLPGFMKEQIKISTRGRNTIVVGGERLVAGNKWNQFHEEFQAPCEINSLLANYQGGILNIKVPKEDQKSIYTEEMADDANGNALQTKYDNPRKAEMKK